MLRYFSDTRTGNRSCIYPRPMCRRDCVQSVLADILTHDMTNGTDLLSRVQKRSLVARYPQTTCSFWHALSRKGCHSAFTQSHHAALVHLSIADVPATMLGASIPSILLLMPYLAKICQLKHMPGKLLSILHSGLELMRLLKVHVRYHIVYSCMFLRGLHDCKKCSDRQGSEDQALQ